jgi:hypothetical protein
MGLQTLYGVLSGREGDVGEQQSGCNKYKTQDNIKGNNSGMFSD